MAQTQKGLRPDFGPAMPPAEAKALYGNWLSMPVNNLLMSKQVFLLLI